MGGETKRFCSLDQAVEQMAAAGGIDVKGIEKDLHGRRSAGQISEMVRIMATDIIKRKLAEGKESNKLEIHWRDIYDLRGSVSAWVCNEGSRFYCVSSFVDAVGSGLTGSAIGRGITYAGLTLAGPPGFILMSGMEITERTFQCTPDTLALFLDSGGTAVILLPWCKVPGAKALCVRAAQTAGKTAYKVMGRYLNKEYAIGVARVMEYDGGGEFVKVVAEQAKETAVRGTAKKVHSNIISPEIQNMKVPIPETPVPAKTNSGSRNGHISAP